MGGSLHRCPALYHPRLSEDRASPPLPRAGGVSHPTDLEPGTGLALVNAMRADVTLAMAEQKRKVLSPYGFLPALFFFSLCLW